VEEPTDDAASQPGANPYVGAWQYAATIRIEYTSSGPETTVVDQGPYDTAQVWNPQIAPFSLIITPTQMISTLVIGSHECVPVDLPSYRVESERIVALDWVSNAVAVPETLRMWLNSPDTLVRYHTMLNAPCDDSWVVYWLYERDKAFDACAYCPDVPFTLAECRTYPCDTAASLVLTVYDNTPQDTLDPGAYLHSAWLEVNGRRVVPTQAYRTVARQAFETDRDDVLLPRGIPKPVCQSGYSPFIVQFQTAPQMWVYEDDTSTSPAGYDSMYVCAQVAGSCRLALLDGSQDIAVMYDAGQPLMEVLREVAELGRAVPGASGLTRTGLNAWIGSVSTLEELPDSGSYPATTIRHRWF